MKDATISNRETFELVDKALVETVDKEITGDLDYCLDVVKKRSQALASSLKRCFNNARKSLRYVLVYNLGKENAARASQLAAQSDEELEKYLEDYLKDYFEKNDFMHYREFVRLNRACAIDAGIEISSKIKNMYNEFFLGKRLKEAYNLGKKNTMQFLS